MTNNGQRWVFREEAEPQTAGSGLIRRILAYNPDMMCVENTFAQGAVAPLHSHVHTQIAYVVEGAFAFEVDGETKTVRKGDSILLESNVPHACICVEAGIVLDIFTPMRQDFV